MENKENIMVQLNKVTDFTGAKLVKYLNNKYNVKKGGNKFTLGDIQQYIKRGFLPRLYGDHPIERIVINEIGISLIRVHFNIIRHNN